MVGIWYVIRAVVCIYIYIYTSYILCTYLKCPDMMAVHITRVYSRIHDDWCDGDAFRVSRALELAQRGTCFVIQVPLFSPIHCSSNPIPGTCTPGDDIMFSPVRNHFFFSLSLEHDTNHIISYDVRNTPVARLLLVKNKGTQIRISRK